MYAPVYVYTVETDGHFEAQRIPNTLKDNLNTDPVHSWMLQPHKHAIIDLDFRDMSV